MLLQGLLQLANNISLCCSPNLRTKARGAYRESGVSTTPLMYYAYPPSPFLCQKLCSLPFESYPTLTQE